MTRRALKTAEATKAKGVDQLCEVGRGSTNSTSSGAALIGYKAGDPFYNIFASRRERGCRRSLQPGETALKTGGPCFARFSAPLEKPRWPPPDNDAECAGVIAHADHGVDQLPHGLPVQIRPPSD